MPKIQHRRGTATNLAAANPTPLAGELIWDSTANAIKIGDGATAWTSLAYVTATPRSHVHDGADITTGTVAYARLPVGSTASTVCAGDDARLSNARQPTSHTHDASAVASGTLDIERIPTGTTATTVCIGNDSRLSNARTPTSHTHGNITNAGAIGATANLPVITTTSGVLTVGSFGTAANTFCQGNDARLSDTRTPTDGTVTTAKLANDAVTYAKIQNVTATDRILGRSTAGAGDIEEIVCTSFARTLLDDTTNTAARTTLGAAASSHTHGNITNAGAIGTTANLPVITTTSGVLTAGSFGTAANTFCQGNDARLSDTRTPTDGSVTTAKIVDGAVTAAKLAAGILPGVSRGTITASASQTTFGITGGYQSGAIDVFLNGVKLISGTDYTATDGSNVVLASAAASGDVVDYVAYTSAQDYSVSNAVTRGSITATAGQTAFTINGGYQSGAIDIFLNGVKLAPTAEYTATNGTSITLGEAASAGDLLDYVAYQASTNVAVTYGTQSGTVCEGNDPRLALKAWVNFNGQGVVAIRASYNVSSITDLAIGKYKVNFTTAITDANYAVCLGTGDLSWGNKDFVISFATTDFEVWSIKGDQNALADSPIVCASVFR